MAEHPHGHSPLGEMTTAMTGASVDHEAPIGPPADAVVQKGHEADTFGVKSILMVPVAVLVMALVTYALVQGIFRTVNPPQLVAGDAAKEASERFAKISSTDPNAPVKQPRLEPIRITESTRNGKTDPEFFRSVRFGESGNSPEYYPEDLRADNYIDPATKQKVLRDYSWVIDKKIARIPVGVAMELLVSEKMLPVQTTESKPTVGTATVPKLSNGGRGLPPEEKTEPAKADGHKDEKKDDHK